MDAVLDILVKLAMPAALALGFILIKKACSLLAKKLNVEISDKEQALIDNIIDMAVRVTEESAKTNKMSSDEKENMALGIALNDIKVKIPEATLRNKIKARVSTIWH